MPKTTGNRGIHVFSELQPRWTSYDVRSAAVAVARELGAATARPITAAWWKEERGTRVFVDFNQNAPHKTIFGAWSVRARPGAQVSYAVFVGGARDNRSRRPDDRHRARRRYRVGRSVDTDDRRSAVSRAGPRTSRTRPRQRTSLDAPWPPVYPKMPDEPRRVAPSRAKKPKE